jgi:hypothetical protein
MATSTQTQTKTPYIKHPETIAVDPEHPLAPTHALFLTHNKDSTFVLDLTPSLGSLYFPPEDTDAAKKEFGLALTVATTVAKVSPAPPTIYTVKKENLVGTKFIVKDGACTQLLLVC